MVERVTSLEVAKRAGVSQSAVSRVYTPVHPFRPRPPQRSKPPRRNWGIAQTCWPAQWYQAKAGSLVGRGLSGKLFLSRGLGKTVQRPAERGYHVLIFMASQTAGNISSVVDEIWIIRWMALSWPLSR